MTGLPSALLALVFTAASLQAQDNPLPDATTVQQKMIAAYYHPHGLAEITCDVRPDWDKLFRLQHIQPESDQAKYLRASVFHIDTAPRRAPIFGATWSKDTPMDFAKSTGSSEANAYRQMVSGFFQAWWSFTDSSIAPAEDNVRVERTADGNLKLLGSHRGSEVETTLNSDYLPVKTHTKNAMSVSELTMRFVKSPAPSSGEPFRLRAFEVSNSVGVNYSTSQIDFDTQDVRDFHIPKTVNAAVPGAFLLSFDLTNCAVRRTDDPAPPTANEKVPSSK